MSDPEYQKREIVSSIGLKEERKALNNFRTFLLIADIIESVTLDSALAERVVGAGYNGVLIEMLPTKSTIAAEVTVAKAYNLSVWAFDGGADNYANTLARCLDAVESGAEGIDIGEPSTWGMTGAQFNTIQAAVKAIAEIPIGINDSLVAQHAFLVEGVATPDFISTGNCYQDADWFFEILAWAETYNNPDGFPIPVFMWVNLHRQAYYRVDYQRTITALAKKYCSGIFGLLSGATYYQHRDMIFDYPGFVRDTPITDILLPQWPYIFNSGYIAPLFDTTVDRGKAFNIPPGYAVAYMQVYARNTNLVAANITLEVYDMDNLAAGALFNTTMAIPASQTGWQSTGLLTATQIMSMWGIDNILITVSAVDAGVSYGYDTNRFYDCVDNTGLPYQRRLYIAIRLANYNFQRF